MSSYSWTRRMLNWICQRANIHHFFFCSVAIRLTRFHLPLSTLPRYGYYLRLDGCHPCIDEQLRGCRQHLSKLRLPNSWRNVYVWSNQCPMDVYGFLVAVDSQHYERKCCPAGSAEHLLSSELNLPDGGCGDCKRFSSDTKAAIQWLWRLLPTDGQRDRRCWNRPNCGQLYVELC